MKYNVSTVIAAGALLLAVQSARAITAPLLPGGTSPVPLDGGPGGASLATLASPFNWSINGKNINGTLTSSVYNDGVYNPLGLTFTYTIDLNSSAPQDNLSLLTVNSYAGFLTLVGQNPDSINSTAVSADRSADGNKVQFHFATPPSPTLYTDGTVTFVIATDAQNYARTEGAISDGLTQNLGIIAPTRTTNTPDGGTTAMLLGIGFLGAASVRRKLS